MSNKFVICVNYSLNCAEKIHLGVQKLLCCNQMELSSMYQIDIGVCKKVRQMIFLKFIYSEKATKILRNHPLTFDYST